MMDMYDREEYETVQSIINDNKIVDDKELKKE